VACAAAALVHHLRGAFAQRLRAVLLSPVFATQSHADARALGPCRLRFIAQQSPVAVYALGGVDAMSAGRLKGARLAGLAAIGGWAG